MASKNTKAHLPTLSALQVEEAVRAALLEDLGLAGDVTSDATIPAKAKAVWKRKLRCPTVFCANLAFHYLKDRSKDKGARA